MRREILIIDLVLAALLAGAGLKLYVDWEAFEATHDPGAIRFEGDAVGIPEAPAEAPRPESGNWLSIAENNLFSFDRNDIAVEAPAGPVATGPRPILFGTVSLGSGPMAMLAPGEPGNRAYRPVSLGEVIDGWTLVEIADKSVVLESGGVRQTVLMNDPTAQVARDRTRTVSRGGGGPTVSTVQAPNPQGGAGGTPTAGRTPATGAPTEDNVPPGYRLLRTPFGNKIVRDPGQ